MERIMSSRAVAGLVLIFAAPLSAQELMLDSCFELFTGSEPNVVPYGWTRVQNSGTVDNKIETCCSLPRCGSDALRSVGNGTSTTEKSSFYRDVSNLKPGGSYTFTLWARRDSCTGGFNVESGISVATDGACTSYWDDTDLSCRVSGAQVRADSWTPQVSGSGTWIQHSVTWTQPACSTTARLLFGSTHQFGCDSLVYFDSPSLTGPIDTGSVVNGTMEGGFFDTTWAAGCGIGANSFLQNGWGWDNNGNMRAADETTIKHAGAHSQRLAFCTGGGTDGTRDGMFQVVNVSANSTYYFTVWARHDNGNCPSIMAWNPGSDSNLENAYTAGAGRYQWVTTDNWNELGQWVSRTMTINTGASTQITIFAGGAAHAGTSNGNVYIDDVCLVKSPATAAPAVPTVNNPTPSTLNIANNAGDSGTLYFAFRINGGAFTNQYVNSSTGAVQAGASWATKATWGTKTVTGLAANTTYTFVPLAATDVSGSCASADGASASGTTAAGAALTVTIDQAAGQSDPTSTWPINFTVVFSAAVADFATGDVTLSGTAFDARAIAVGTVTGSGTTYNVAVTGMTNTGTVIATIAAGVAHDASSTANSASTSTDNQVQFNNAAQNPCDANLVRNFGFGDSTYWAAWSERGAANITRDFNNTTNVPLGGTSPALRMSTINQSYNGGVWQTVVLQPSHKYVIFAKSKDNFNLTNPYWGEILLGYNAPADGSDYVDNCTQNGGVPSPVGTMQMFKWESVSSCTNPTSCKGWNGDETTACGRPNYRPTFTTDAVHGTYYLVLKIGVTQDSGNVDISYDTIIIRLADPTVTTPANQSVCAGATATFSVTGTTAGTSADPLAYQWQKKPPAGSFANIPGATGSSYTTPILTVSDSGTLYHCIVTDACNRSATSGDATLTVNQPATPTPSSNSPICAGATLNLSTAAVGGATYSWTGPNGFASSAQNPTIANATTAATGTYSLTVTVAGCTSLAGTTSVTVNATPATPTGATATPAAICSGNSSTLSATAGAGGDQVQWFTGSCGGTLLGTGNQTVSPAATTTYFARSRVTISGCVSVSCASVSVTVTPPLSAPTSAQASPATICAGQSSTLSAIAGSGGDQVQWFTGSCGGTLLGTGNQIVSPAVTTTYFARTHASASNCDSASCSSVSVTVNPAVSVPTAAQASPATICAGQTSILSATAGSGGDQVQWFTGSCNGTLLGTGNQTVSPAATTTYFAATRSSTTTCVSATCATVSVTVNSTVSVPTAAQASPATICAGQTSTLSATAGSGGDQVQWFTGSCGGTPVGTGNQIVSPGATTTYFARTNNTSTGCASATCATVTVTVNPTVSVPTAAQASPATICAGASSTLSATAGTNGDQVQWFTGSCGGTLLGTGNQIVSPGATTTYFARSRSSTTTCTSATCATVSVTVNPAVAVPTAPQASPATICAGQTSTLSATVGAGGDQVQWFTGSCGGTLLGTGNQTVSPAATTTYFARTNNSGTGCTSATCATATVTVNPVVSVPTAAQASPATICPGGSSVLSATAGTGGDQVQWFTGSCGGSSLGTGNQTVSPAATTTYFARTNSTATGCSSATCATVSVTVSPAVSVPTSPQASPATICAGQSSTLSAVAGSGGDQVQWFTGSCGGTLLGTGNQIVSPGATTTYFARTRSSATTCTSATCAAVSVTVNSTPAAPTNAHSTPTTICVGQSAVLAANAGAGETVDWFTGSCGGTPVPGGAGPTVSPSSTTTYFARARNSTTNCNSTTCATASVTVNPISPPVAFCKNISVNLGPGGSVTVNAIQVDNGSTGDAACGQSITTYQIARGNFLGTCATSGSFAPSVAFTCADLGVQAVTLRVTQSDGQKSCCTASVTVSPAGNCPCGVPTASCLASITRTIGAGGTAVTITPNDVDNGSAAGSLCTLSNRQVSKDGVNFFASVQFSCSELGSHSVTLKITQSDNQTATCATQVTINDAGAQCPCPAPTALCTSAFTRSIGAGGTPVTIAPNDVDNGSTAGTNCAITTRLVSKDGVNFFASVQFNCSELGPHQVTLKVTQSDSQSATCAVQVTINDANAQCPCAAPTAKCVAGLTRSIQAGGSVTVLSSEVNNGSTAGANCTVTAVQIAKDGVNFGPSVTFDCGEVGQRTITLKITQSDNQSAMCTTPTTINDASRLCICTAPTAACKAFTLNLTSDGMGGGTGTLLPADIDNGSTPGGGACAISTREVSRDGINFFPSLKFNCFDLGTRVITLRVTQSDNQTAVCTAIVTIADPQNICGFTCAPPNAVCKNAMAPLTGGDLFVPASSIDGGSTPGGGPGNCKITSVEARRVLPSAGELGPTFRVICADVGRVMQAALRVTQDNGLASECLATVTVDDVTAPIIFCPSDRTIAPNPGTCQATGVDIGNANTGDNCGVASLTDDRPAAFSGGTTTVTWKVTDTNGLTATCKQHVTVEDTAAPTITCPADVIVNLNGPCTATNVNLGSPTTGDNCPGVTSSNDAPSSYPVGQTPVTWKATDASGNTATCVQKVTVNDLSGQCQVACQAPTAICRATLTVTLSGNQIVVQAAQVDNGSHAAAGCTIQSLQVKKTFGGFYDTSVTFTCSDVGTKNVTLKVTQSDGKTAECTCDVTIQDTTPPIFFNCPGDRTVPPDPGTCQATNVSLGSPNVTDVCGLAAGSPSNDAPNAFPTGTTNVTWTATDLSGNTATCIEKVTVESCGINSPTLTTAASRRKHGAVGTFDINLPLSGAAAIEPRLNGTDPQVILTFSAPLEASDGSLDCGQEVAVTNGTCSLPTISGNTLTVNVAATNNKCVRIVLSGLRGAGGGTALGGDTDVEFIAQQGNVNGTSGVNILDLQAIKNQLFQAVTGANFKTDVNVNGSINILDLQACKNNLFQAASCP